MSIAKNPNSRRTDAARRTQNAWAAVNRITLAAKVDTATGERFRAICEASGQTVNAALVEYVRACLDRGSLPPAAKKPEQPERARSEQPPENSPEVPAPEQPARKSPEQPENP